MKQPNANAKLKLRYRILDNAFRFLKKNWLIILIAIPIIVILIWMARLLYNHFCGPSPLDKVGSFFSNAINSVKDGVSHGWNAVTNGVSNVWSSVTGIFS